MIKLYDGKFIALISGSVKALTLVNVSKKIFEINDTAKRLEAVRDEILKDLKNETNFSSYSHSTSFKMLPQPAAIYASAALNSAATQLQNAKEDLCSALSALSMLAADDEFGEVKHLPEQVGLVDALHCQAILLMFPCKHDKSVDGLNDAYENYLKAIRAAAESEAGNE